MFASATCMQRLAACAFVSERPMAATHLQCQAECVTEGCPRWGRAVLLALLASLLSSASFIRRTWDPEEGSANLLFPAQLSEISWDDMEWIVTPSSVRFHQAAKVRWRARMKREVVRNCPASP